MAPPPDTTPPHTQITQSPVGRIIEGPVDVAFTSDDPTASYTCRLDQAPAVACASPFHIQSPSRAAHTVTVSATDSAGNSDDRPPTAAWRTIAARIDLCGTLAQSTTLTPDDALTYVLTCTVDVPTGLGLTAEPGTIVKAANGAGIVGHGAIRAIGSASAPITFTSLDDPTVVGPSGDGAPAPGDWPGIAVSGALDLEHADVSYFRQVLGTDGAAATLIVANDAFAHAAGPVGGAALSATVRDSTFTAGSGFGAVAINAATLHVTGNTVSDFLGNDGPYLLGSPALDFTELSTNHSNSGVMNVSGAATTSTWSGSLPLVTIGLGAPAERIGFAGLDVPASATLTLAPDTVFKSAAIDNQGTPAITVEGTLHAAGTASAPITFTSYRDSTIGNQVLGYAQTPAPGDWPGIRFATATTADDQIDRVFFAYAGTAISIGNLNLLAVTHSQFANNQAAFTVDSTSENDPGLAVAAAAAGDCVPPYTSAVDASTDYFGATGYPGASINLNDFIGEALPDDATVQGAFAAISTYYSLEGQVSNNTIPYALFDCLGVTFPVTPILVGGGTVMSPAGPVTRVPPFSSDFEAAHGE